MTTFEHPFEITTGLVAAQDLQENQLFIISDSGLEEIVKNELLRSLEKNGCNNPRITAKPFGYGGQLWITTPKNIPLYALAIKLRSIHFALIPIHYFDIKNKKPLSLIENEVGKISFPILERARSFRVTTHRTGKHNFKSMDVERRAGAAIWRKYNTSVDLKNPEVDIHVNIYEDVCFLGFPLHTKSLSKRFQRQFQPRIAIKASIAYALLQLGKVDPSEGSTVLDPFCGSGTILFEAAHYNSKITLYGSDIDPYIVEGAQNNIKGLGLTKSIQILQGDARELNKIFPQKLFDHIITNPPYGLRFGQHLNFERFYIRILQQFYYRLKLQGTVAIITLKWKDLSTAIRLTGFFEILEKYRVDMGDVKPLIVSLRRKQRKNNQ